MSESSSVSVQEHERRQFFRIDMEEELIDILWQSETGQQQSKKITCLDFSRGGVRANCEEIIPLNTLVTIIFQAADPSSQSMEGRVLRCLKQPNGSYQIALKLTD